MWPRNTQNTGRNIGVVTQPFLPMAFSLLSMSGFTQRMSWSIIQQRLRDTRKQWTDLRERLSTALLHPYLELDLRPQALGKT